mmetsp:Transcript_10270/g.11846  ORF Transcript_10270/g.11846 Transcript_10270/m.11846 type:complete len:89 (+) Transcript_10270:778-1044(+)
MKGCDVILKANNTGVGNLFVRCWRNIRRILLHLQLALPDGAPLLQGVILTVEGHAPGTDREGMTGTEGDLGRGSELEVETEVGNETET